MSSCKASAPAGVSLNLESGGRQIGARHSVEAGVVEALLASIDSRRCEHSCPQKCTVGLCRTRRSASTCDRPGTSSSITRSSLVSLAPTLRTCASVHLGATVMVNTQDYGAGPIHDEAGSQQNPRAEAKRCLGLRPLLDVHRGISCTGQRQV